MTLKIAVEAPIPRARVTAAMIANAGLLRRLRRAKRMSWPSVPMMCLRHSCETPERDTCCGTQMFLLRCFRSTSARKEAAARTVNQDGGCSVRLAGSVAGQLKSPGLLGRGFWHALI